MKKYIVPYPGHGIMPSTEVAQFDTKEEAIQFCKGRSAALDVYERVLRASVKIEFTDEVATESDS